jgi:predicted methyltransferase
MSRLLLVAAASAACLASGVALAADAPSPAVAAAVADVARPHWDIPRDPRRHPAEVVAFSQIKPGDNVVDLVPGDGYYTRILSKLVGPKGKVYALVPEKSAGEGRKPGTHDAINAIIAIAYVKDYANLTPFWLALNQYGGQFPFPEQLDAVFTADGYHGLYDKDGIGGDLDMRVISKKIFQALKPGGVFLVADYASAKGAGAAAAKALGRADEDVIKADLLAAGFVVDGESKLLASSTDDHRKAASDLAHGDKADQFVVRFKKPATASGETKRPKTDPLKNYYGNTYVYNIGSGGNVSGDRPRHHFYHPDGTYQELGEIGKGPGPLQEGWVYWDADGHNCQVHQFPMDERPTVVCHALVPLEIGQKTMQDNGGGAGPKPVTLLKGHVYPGDLPGESKPKPED